MKVKMCYERVAETYWNNPRIDLAVRLKYLPWIKTKIVAVYLPADNEMALDVAYNKLKSGGVEGMLLRLNTAIQENREFKLQADENCEKLKQIDKSFKEMKAETTISLKDWFLLK